MEDMYGNTTFEITSLKSVPKTVANKRTPVEEDTRVAFPSYFVRYPTKTAQRAFVAMNALTWLNMQHKRGCKGAIMVDIDDTLIDGNEAVLHGFQDMRDLYTKASVLFPLHIVTARPREDHHSCMKMLAARGFCIPPDRLHMLPTHLYGQDTSHVEDFKWQTFLNIAKAHQGVVARFGDKMWDVAHMKALRGGYLEHVRDRDCYIFYDPALKGTASFKLPGSG